MIILLKLMLDEGIKPDITEQITILENIFSLKMETLLTQIILSKTNTQRADVDRIYDRF